jgi:hypothetical protein
MTRAEIREYAIHVPLPDVSVSEPLTEDVKAMLRWGWSQQVRMEGLEPAGDDPAIRTSMPWSPEEPQILIARVAGLVRVGCGVQGT